MFWQLKQLRFTLTAIASLGYEAKRWVILTWDVRHSGWIDLLNLCCCLHQISISKQARVQVLSPHTVRHDGVHVGASPSGCFSLHNYWIWRLSGHTYCVKLKLESCPFMPDKYIATGPPDCRSIQLLHPDTQHIGKGNNRTYWCSRTIAYTFEVCETICFNFLQIFSINP